MITIRIDSRDVLARLNGEVARLNPERYMPLVGARLLAWVDENFRAEGLERRWKPLSPNTVAARRKAGRGGVQILRDRGILAQSFTMRTSGARAEVGTQDVRAAWHHAGTMPYTIRPKPPRTTLRFLTAAGWRSSKLVRHPGLPARPLLPSRALAATIALETIRAYLGERVAAGRR